MIDYHIHTPLCNHAVGQMSEYVEVALKKGLSEICFLDHLIISGLGQKNSMAIEDIPAYYDEIQRVKDLYSDRINVRSGLEVDFDPENIQQLEKILDQFSFDVIGSSVHFINGVNIASRREAAVSSASEEKILVRRYFETLRQMLNFGYFDIVCHFDIVKKTGRAISDEFLTEIDDILSIVAKKKLAIELNTSGWDHPAGACYPSEGVIKKCVEAGIPFVLSSDAHKPEEVGRYFDRAVQILSSAGCRQVCIFENRKRRYIEIE